MSTSSAVKPTGSAGSWSNIAERLATASDEELQLVFAAAVRNFSARAEVREIAAFPADGVTATDVVIASTEMLKAVELQPFELAMWQAWSHKS